MRIIFSEKKTINYRKTRLLYFPLSIIVILVIVTPMPLYKLQLQGYAIQDASSQLPSEPSQYKLVLRQQQNQDSKTSFPITTQFQ
jgi:hypothetical protein